MITRAAIVAFLIIAALCSGCSSRRAIPVGELPAFPPPAANDIAAGKALVEGGMGFTKQALHSTGADVVRAKRVVARLSRAAGFGATSIPVYVVDAGDDVNALAVHGGAIVIYRKLLERVKSPDELAVILGHEIAHMAARHHEDEGEKERASGVSVFSSVLGSAAAIAVAVTTGSGAAGNLVGGVTEATTGTIADGAIVKSYSRDMETEADHVGLMLMAKAGYDPATAVQFWKNADRIFGEDMNGSSFLSTHPSGPERIKALEAALPYTDKHKPAGNAKR